MRTIRLKATSLDYALAALAPVFIIPMIGSLVAFLITALYQGAFPIRLMWILGSYTFASVLIARIAIEQSRSQAMVYLGPLGGATLLVAPRYFVIEGDLAAWSLPILITFLLLITFLADRITYDCTNIDETGDANGEGLLQSLGLLRNSRLHQKAKPSRRKHNPGVWVLYFALLALPVFGIGQLVIATSSGRRLAWMTMIAYLLSALLLLVMISLISVRRYARQRGLEMEAGMSMKWLAAGGASNLLLILVTSILPLPTLDGGLWEPPFKITSRDDLKSHRWGWGNEKVGNQQQGNQQQPEPPQDSSDMRREAVPPPPEREPLPRIEWNPGASLRWLMVLILFGIAVFFAIRHRREVVAWIRDSLVMIKAWFFRDPSSVSEAPSAHDDGSGTVSKRFVDFPDPFAMYSGDPDRTIQALFDATCLWGQEQRVVRRENETPEEFVTRLGRMYARISEGLSRLGMVYCRLAYAQKHVAPGDIQVLQTLWEWMVQHPPRNATSDVILN